MSLFLFRVFTSSYLANFSKTFSVDLIVFFKRAISSCPILGYLLGPCREGGYDFFSSEKMQTKTEIDKQQDHLFGLSMAETNTESQNGKLIQGVPGQYEFWATRGSYYCKNRTKWGLICVCEQASSRYLVLSIEKSKRPKTFSPSYPRVIISAFFT